MLTGKNGAVQRPAPERADIEPGAIRQALSDTFILELADATRRSFIPACRNSGLRAIRPRAQRRILRQSLGHRQPASDFRPADDLVRRKRRHRCRSDRGERCGEPLDLELLLLPLGTRRPSLARTIGILAPLNPPAWLGATALGALTLGGRRHVGATGKTRLVAAFHGSAPWPRRPPRRPFLEVPSTCEILSRQFRETTY